jgi:uncharacterized protein
MANEKRPARKDVSEEKRPARGGVEQTADGRYIVVDGRRWRATNPNLPAEERQRLVNELMAARREVGRAQRAGDKEAEVEARRRVHAAKVALGERGPVWWEEKTDGG